MNSKLRDILSDYRLACALDEQMHFDKPKVKDTKWLQWQYEIHDTEAEKAIRQAVGEEMLAIIDSSRGNDSVHNMNANREREVLRFELRQKIKQWQGCEDDQTNE